MRITVLGGGAMGGLFSCLLSEKNDVTVIDHKSALAEKIEKDGFYLTSPAGERKRYTMKARTNSDGMEVQDLVILFVKSMYNIPVLTANKAIIGPDTFVMSMQNGMGHEEVLRQFVDDDHAILGTTQHNAAIVALGENKHNGAGPNAICNLSGRSELCQHIARVLSEAGFDTSVSTDVQRMIWHKLFTNASVSILTGILQVKLGYIAENSAAHSLCVLLIKEAVAVARADGFAFDEAQIIDEVTAVCTRSPNGITSIAYDLSKGNKTEVDTISGAVARKARLLGIPAPHTETVVALVHALEGKAEIRNSSL